MEVTGYISGIVEENLQPLLADFAGILNQGSETQPLMPDDIPDVRILFVLT